ncbi:MAG: hypothetical protein JNK72_20255 [Myxococcales bacterium]|nr:hypothetical protein [Myxococcales bacterium]
MLRPVRWALSTLSTLVGLWVFFFVPVGGPRTLWDHTRRILGTPEARELGHDLGNASNQVADRMRREVIPTLMNLDDGGLRDAAVDGAVGAPPAR